MLWVFPRDDPKFGIFNNFSRTLGVTDDLRLIDLQACKSRFSESARPSMNVTLELGRRQIKISYAGWLLYGGVMETNLAPTVFALYCG